MVERRELDRRIKGILALCLIVNKDENGPGSETYKAKDLILWKEIRQLDDDAKSDSPPGNRGSNSIVQPGRLVQWGVKDGYARYIVSRVGKHDCKLVHLPYLEGYISNFVDGDTIPTRDLEKLLEWERDLDQEFERRLTK